MSTTNPTDTVTEWEELQVKYGNWAPRPKTVTSEALSQAAIEFAEQQDPLAHKTLAELNALEDDVEEETLEKYRQKRLEELRRERECYQFGSVVHVVKSDYVKEVAEASKQSPSRYVVLLLYNNSSTACQLLIRSFDIVAKRHGYVKFCKAIGKEIIQDFPDSRIPTVLIYHNGTCARQILGAEIWGGEGLTANCVEWLLWKYNVLKSAERDTDPRPNRKGRRAAVEEEEEEEEEVPASLNSCGPGRKGRIVYTASQARLAGFSDDENAADSEDEERAPRRLNPDGRGYGSLALEQTLRLK